jgi:23S rRNA G2445 N2-methylase RlmL
MDAPNHYIGFDSEENTISFAIENAAAAAPQVNFRQMEAEEIPPEVRKAIIEHLTREDDF